MEGKKEKKTNIKEICTQLLNNLLSIHNNKIVHRDIKPDNILFRYGNYILADFGTLILINDISSKFKENKDDTLEFEQILQGTPK